MSEAPYKIHRGMRGDEVIDAVERTAYVRADAHDKLQAELCEQRGAHDRAAHVVRDLLAERDQLQVAYRSLLTDHARLQSCERSMQRWKLMAEYQFAMRVYPDELALGSGALDATMATWTGDGYKAIVDEWLERGRPGPKQAEASRECKPQPKSGEHTTESVLQEVRDDLQKLNKKPL